jgi:hypothetical protein
MGLGTMTISGYAWGHIVATGPRSSETGSAGTSAPLILTHDPLLEHKSINESASGVRINSLASLRVSSVEVV